MSRGYREASLGYPLWVLETSWDTPLWNMITIKMQREETHPHHHHLALLSPHS